MSPAARSAVAAALIATVFLSACAGERPTGAASPRDSSTRTTTRAATRRTKRPRRHRRPLVTVAEVIDGDTIALTNGEHVRLVQIDAPEVAQGECYARPATAALERMAPPGTRIRLEADPRLDQ